MADEVITITIPDQYVSRVATVYTGLGGRELILTGGESTYTISYPEKTTENTRQYILKNIKRTLKGLVEYYESELDAVRRRVEIQAVHPVDVSVPDEIIETT